MEWYTPAIPVFLVLKGVEVGELPGNSQATKIGTYKHSSKNKGGCLRARWKIKTDS